MKRALEGTSRFCKNSLSLSLWERAGVRELGVCRTHALTLTLSQRERGHDCAVLGVKVR